MRAFLLFLLKLSLTVLCLWWAFSGIDLKDSVLTQPGKVDYRWLTAGVVLAGLGVVLTAWRWWFFMKVQAIDVSLGRAVELTMIGNLFNLISVGSIGGDAARIILLSRDHPGKKLPLTMSVLLDHMAGMVTIAVAFFVISAAQFDALVDQSVIGREVIRFAWFYIGGGLALVVLSFICASPPVHRRIHANNRLGRWPILRKMPEIYDIYRRNWKLTLAGLVVSFFMLFSYFASFWCGMRAVGGMASFDSVMTAMPVIDALSSLPISVGGVGVRENLFKVLMHDIAGVSAKIAVSASLAGFTCNLVWALLGALFFLKKSDRVKISELESGTNS